MPPYLLTLSLSPLPVSEPFSLMPTDCPICSLLSLSPSPWSASVHLSISCHLSFVPWCLSLCLPHCLCLLPSLWILPSPSCSLSCLLLSPPSVPSACFPLASFRLGVCLLDPPPHPPPRFLPMFLSSASLPPGYEKSRSLSSIAGLSGVSLRLAPLATPPGSPRAARRAPPTLPSIL